MTTVKVFSFQQLSDVLSTSREMRAVPQTEEAFKKMSDERKKVLTYNIIRGLPGSMFSTLPARSPTSPEAWSGHLTDQSCGKSGTKLVRKNALSCARLDGRRVAPMFSSAPLRR
eukprot:5573631-Amphidinium_carterae.1